MQNVSRCLPSCSFPRLFSASLLAIGVALAIIAGIAGSNLSFFPHIHSYWLPIALGSGVCFSLSIIALCIKKKEQPPEILNVVLSQPSPQAPLDSGGTDNFASLTNSKTEKQKEAKGADPGGIAIQSPEPTTPENRDLPKIEIQNPNLRISEKLSANATDLFNKGLNDRNPKTSLEHFRNARTQGHPEASFFIGLCYEKGHGVDQNLSFAFGYYIEAGNLGEGKSQLKVAKKAFEQNELEKGKNWLKAYKGNYPAPAEIDRLFIENSVAAYLRFIESELRKQHLV